MTSGKLFSLVRVGAHAAGGAGMLIGGIWLLAWFTGNIHRFAAGTISMATNVAAAVFLAGVALLLLIPEATSFWRRVAGIAASVLVSLIGVLSLSEHVFRYNLGIDELLATFPADMFDRYGPNRMGPPASLALTVLGVGLLFLATRRRQLAPYFGLAVCLIIFVPAMGCIFGGSAVLGGAKFLGIAWSTVVALMSLGSGLMLAHLQTGPMQLLLRDDPGGVVVRRLLPVAILGPPALGYLNMLGERAQLYDPSTSNTVLVMVRVLVMLFLLWQVGEFLSSSTAKQAKTKLDLLHSEEQFRTLANSIPQLAWMANGDGWIFWFNQRWYEYTGASLEQMKGWGWQSVHDPAMLPRVMELWSNAIAKGEPIDEVVSLRGKDGVFRPFLTRVMPVKDINGKVARWFGTSTDISEQKQIEAELRTNKARLDLAMSTMDLGEWELDLKSRKAARSLRHDQIFGYETLLPEWTTEMFFDHILPQYRDSIRQQARESNRQGKWEMEVPILRADGEKRWIWVRGRAFADETGKPIRVIGVIMDITARKQAEQHIAHLASFPEVNPNPIFETDLNGTVTYVNPATVRQLSSFKNPDPTHLLLKDWQSVIEDLKSREERSLVREVETDGCTFLQTIHYSPELGVVRAYLTDITEHKRTEQELRDSQERLSAIVSSAMDAVITLDSAQRAVVFNAAAERIFGCSAEDALGKTLDRFIPEQFRELHKKHIEQFVDSGTSGRPMASKNLLYGLRANGEQFPLEATISRVMVTGKKLSTVILRDITERISAEKELREKEERFRSMYEHAAVGIEQVAVDGRLLMVNPALCRMLGYSEAELLSKNFAEITHPDDRAREGEMLNSMLSGSRDGYELEKRYVRRDGAITWASLTSSLVKDISGHPLYRISVIQDITQRRHAEDQLQQAHKMEAIGRLAGGVAHDFNTLLSVILGYSEFALAELPSDDPSRERVEQIEKSARAGALLTKQLLAFSRKQSIAMQVVDLRDVVHGMEPMLRRLLAEDIEIEVRLSPGKCPVKADSGQLQQVVLNLAANAGHAMPRGGRLMIESKSIALANGLQKHISLPVGRYEVLTVSDTGVGMDSETVSHVFEPFFTTRAVGEGTGLGLATVYGIVKQNGGDISVYSVPGMGTTFDVYLPRSADHIPEEVSPDHDTGRLTGTETILLVEDSAPLRQLTREVLSQKGYSILEAGDGVEALEVSRSHKKEIQLLITDIVMPRMRGTDLADHIMRERPDIGVVFMSGYASEPMPVNDSPGRITRLEKPCNSQVLLQAVRKALDEIKSKELIENKYDEY